MLNPLPLLVSVALGAEPVEVGEGVLARVGEAVDAGNAAGATVRRIEAHPEFQRYWIEDEAGGKFVAELTRADGLHHGLCEAGGLVLYPRPELVEGELSPVSVQAWCARIPADGAGLAVRATSPGAALQEPEPGSGAGSGWVWRTRSALLAAGVAAIGASVLWWRHRVVVLGLVALSAGVLLLFVDPCLFNGAGAGYEKLLRAWGRMQGELYGPGYPLWMLPGRWLAGDSPEAVFGTNLVFSAVTAACVWLLCGGASARVEWGAAGAAALLPVHLWLSRSEAMHVSAAFWALLGLAAGNSAREGARPWLATMVAIAALWCAVQTRPDMIVAVPAALVLAFDRARLGPAVTILAFGAALVPQALATPSVLSGDRSIVAMDLVRALTPRLGPAEAERTFQTFLHAAFTPVTWWILAAVGLGSLGWAARLRWLAVIGLCTAPFVAKVDPLADALRLQLLAGLAWCPLVGAGVARLGRWGWVLLVGGAIPWLVAGQPDWANQAEWRFLAQAVPRLGAEERVLAAPFGHRGEAFRRVMEELGAARWAGEGEATLLYRSVGEPPPGGVPVVTVELVRSADVDLPLPEGPVVVGFYRP